MSIKEQMGYAVVCDFPDCGVATQDLGDYAFWGSFGDALDEWVDHEGYSGDLGHYCREHTVWVSVDEDGGDVDERVPMLPTIENLFVLAERRIAARIDRLANRALLRLGDRTRDLARIQSARIAAAQRAFGADLVEARRVA